jgi:predicted ArsR family transcriptional regulator
VSESWDFTLKIPYVLRKTAWQTVPEIAKKLGVSRLIDRERISATLRQLKDDGFVQVRYRSKLGRGRGCGPLEYAKTP